VGGFSLTLKSAIGLLSCQCLSIMTWVCPVSSAEQAIATVGKRTVT